jgi:hypothetical protein
MALRYGPNGGRRLTRVPPAGPPRGVQLRRLPCHHPGIGLGVGPVGSFPPRQRDRERKTLPRALVRRHQDSLRNCPPLNGGQGTSLVPPLHVEPAVSLYVIQRIRDLRFLGQNGIRGRGEQNLAGPRWRCVTAWEALGRRGLARCPLTVA